MMSMFTLKINNNNKVPNARIREFCGVTKVVDEMIDGVLRWYDNGERIENDMNAKRVYVGYCAGSCSVGKPRKR